MINKRRLTTRPDLLQSLHARSNSPSRAERSLQAGAQKAVCYHFYKRSLVMAQFALKQQFAEINILPGEIQTYRLPTMTRGNFNLSATRENVTQPPGKPGSPGTPVGPGSPGGSGGVTQPGPVLRIVPSSPPAASVGVVALNQQAAGGVPPATNLDAQLRPVTQAPPATSALPATPGSPSPTPQPEDLMMDLLHGDQVVATGLNGLPITPSPKTSAL
jgi:hypothetical protein